MEVETAATLAQAFQHGFSAGVACALIAFGAYLALRDTRRDP